MVPLKITGVALCIVLIASHFAQRGTVQGQAVPAVNDHRATREQLERWMTELSNWARWGKDDEVGAANLITPAKRIQAAALVKTGTVVSLGQPLPTEKAVDNPTPYVVNMIPRPPDVTVERMEVEFHGGTFVHYDGMCHFAYQGKLFNGFSQEEFVTQSGGCARGGTGHLRDKLVTRAILIDVPRLKGLPYLPMDAHIYREDIEAWEKQAGVKVSAGDAIIVRTGRWAHRAANGPGRYRAGLDASVAPFYKERDIALLGADVGNEIGSVPGFPQPTHKIVLVALGATMLDNLDLEALAKTAAALKRWEFMLVVAPTGPAGASGGLINPIAIF